MSSRGSTPGSSSDDGFVDERKPTDKDLPPLHTVSLEGWFNIWKSLSHPQRTRDRDVFALTGHYNDPETGLKRRARIDLGLNRPRDSHVLHQTCDIDSVIGVVLDKFPILSGANLKYYPLQSVKHTLTSNLHIPPVKVEAEDGSNTLVHLHHVANARFMELEPRTLIRIFFPHVQTAKGKHVCVDEDLLRMLYNRAIHPAALETLPEELVRVWPPKYGDETFRARTSRRPGQEEARGRTMEQTGREVHAGFLNAWLQRFREIIDKTSDLKWARSFFFAVEMRGLKNREDSLHPPPEKSPVNEDGEIEEDDPRTRAVDSILKDFDSTSFEPGCWFLDIATTVTTSDGVGLPSASTFASAEMHAHLLSHFADVGWDDSVRYVEGRGNYYQKDEVAQLNDLAGFRFSNPKSEDSGVCYVQVYTSEKSVTYNMSVQHHAQRTTASRLLKSWDSELKDHIEALLTAFSNSAKTHGVALRIETRIEFFHYPNCHLKISEGLLQRCIYWIDNFIFWGWKVARLMSIRSVLLDWIGARAKFTSDELPETGTLFITLTWMMNALVNRPDSGGTWDQIHDAACVHAMVGGQLVPVRPLGALFIPALRYKMNKQPRGTSQRTACISTLCYLISDEDESVDEMELFSRITRTGDRLKRRLESNPWSVQKRLPQSEPAPRLGNKQRRVKIMTTEKLDDKFAGVMPQSEREQYSSEDEDPEERETSTSRSQALTNLIHSYPLQIIAKAPNRGSTGESWCRLSAVQRAKVTFDIFCSMDSLEEAFESYVLISLDQEKWENVVEDLLPTIDHYRVTQEYQGLRTLTARDKFVEILQALAERDRSFVIQEARQYVSKHWVWLPYGRAKKHLWVTGKSGYPKDSRQHGQHQGGPWIVLNPVSILR